MGEVVPFPGCEDANKPAEQQPNKGLIEDLEMLLEPDVCVHHRGYRACRDRILHAGSAAEVAP